MEKRICVVRSLRVKLSKVCKHVQQKRFMTTSSYRLRHLTHVPADRYFIFQVKTTKIIKFIVKLKITIKNNNLVETVWGLRIVEGLTHVVAVINIPLLLICISSQLEHLLVIEIMLSLWQSVI